MENRKAIEKQMKENAEQIKALNAKIDAIVDGVLTVENLKAKAAGRQKGNKQMSSYERGKEKARELAMEFQQSFVDGKTWYWSELAEAYEDFTKLGKKYGLIREFRENGII